MSDIYEKIKKFNRKAERFEKRCDFVESREKFYCAEMVKAKDMMAKAQIMKNNCLSKSYCALEEEKKQLQKELWESIK